MHLFAHLKPGLQDHSRILRYDIAWRTWSRRRFERKVERASEITFSSESSVPSPDITVSYIDWANCQLEQSICSRFILKMDKTKAPNQIKLMHHMSKPWNFFTIYTKLFVFISYRNDNIKCLTIEYTQHNDASLNCFESNLNPLESWSSRK